MITAEEREHRAAAVPARPAEPTTMELAANFTAAMARWTAAGFPTVGPKTYEAREDACERGEAGGPCHFWDGKARFGLGKCLAPGCGCTVFKRWLATERCKHPAGSRWPVDNLAK